MRQMLSVSKAAVRQSTRWLVGVERAEDVGWCR